MLNDFGCFETVSRVGALYRGYIIAFWTGTFVSFFLSYYHGEKWKLMIVCLRLCGGVVVTLALSCCKSSTIHPAPIELLACMLFCIVHNPSALHFSVVSSRVHAEMWCFFYVWSAWFLDKPSSLLLFQSFPADENMKVGIAFFFSDGEINNNLFLFLHANENAG